MTGDINQLADSIFEAVKIYCGAAFDARAREIVKAIDDRFAALPVPKDGTDGKDFDSELIRVRAAEILPGLVERAQAELAGKLDGWIAEAGAAIPIPKDGKDGKDADAEAIAEQVLVKVSGEISDAREADAEAIVADVLERVTKALEAIPVPTNGKDGKDADPELIRLEVAKAITEIPKSKDGESPDPELIAKRVLEQIPIPVNGKDADPEVIRAEVAKAVEAIPKPLNGKDADAEAIAQRVLAEVSTAMEAGKDADVEAIAAEVLDKVTKALEAIPAPVNGKDGRDADPEVIRAEVSKAVEAIPKPKNGKDADPDVIKSEVDRAVAAIPRPKDGESVPLEVVSALVVGEVAKMMASVKDGRDGRDGEPGRDAFAIDVLPAIDLTRRYQRGTWAKHAGGLWVARSQTEGMNGWDCLLDGDADESVELQDDMRTLKYRRVKSSGRVIETTINTGALVDRGIFKADETYGAGDVTTWDGSMWIAQKQTQDKPGTSDAWRLSVKRGRDGRDGIRGEKGERGSEGRAGKDLVAMDLDGRKYSV